MAKEKKSFEDSLARLEKIVSEMEGGSLNLEEMIARFEEGQSLLKFCSKKLNEVEKKVEKLVEKDGDVSTESLDDTADDGNDAGEDAGKPGDLERRVILMFL